MSAEPINLFSNMVDPQGVLALLRRLAPDCRVVGSEDQWEEVVIERKKWFGKPSKLTILHHPDYYDGPDWSRQQAGMQGYFSRFPDGPTKHDVLILIGTFQFSLATSFEPDLHFDSSDWRMTILLSIAEHLKGCFFTPSSLRDAAGRVLIDADGHFDPQAVFPHYLKLAKALLEDDDEEVNDDEKEDVEDPVPPTPSQVVRRMLALSVIVNRGLVEQEDPADAKVAQFPARLKKWIEELGIGDELEPDEWEVLQRPVGRLDAQSTVNSTWRIEGLVVLAWALSLTEVPPHDQLSSPDELFEAIRIFDTQAARDLLENAELRSPEELNDMQSKLLGVHWRLRDFTLRPEPMDFVAFSKDCWFGSFELDGIRTIDNDLAIGENPISGATPNEFDIAHSTARERHQAINWLNWGGKVYSEVDTST